MLQRKTLLLVLGGGGDTGKYGRFLWNFKELLFFYSSFFMLVSHLRLGQRKDDPVVGWLKHFIFITLYQQQHFSYVHYLSLTYLPPTSWFVALLGHPSCWSRLVGRRRPYTWNIFVKFQRTLIFYFLFISVSFYIFKYSYVAPKWCETPFYVYFCAFSSFLKKKYMFKQ